LALLHAAALIDLHVMTFYLQLVSDDLCAFALLGVILQRALRGV